jgi:hypothetical protein
MKYTGVLIHWERNIIEDLYPEKMLVAIVNVEITDVEFSFIKRHSLNWGI